MVLNIAIIGYGKMGHAIESMAKTDEIKILSIIDTSDKNANYTEITKESLEGVDVAIDFSSAASVLSNVEKVARLGKSIVIGTTGWYSDIDKIKAIVENSSIGVVYSPNFSIGVNIFFQIVKNAAVQFNSFPKYDPFVYELHHNRKSDAPGGTAKKLGEILVKNIKRKNKLVYDRIDNKQIDPDEIRVASVRAGYLPGTHVVGFDGEADTIELKHTARSRSGFAEGALFAAKWIKGKSGVYAFEDVIKEVVG